MKLLIDQGLPRSSVGFLANAGHDAVHVGDCGMAKAGDTEIMQLAREQGRAVVTLDGDFHALLAMSQAERPSVIWLRVEGLGGISAAILILRVLEECGGDLIEGAAVTVYPPNRIKVHVLPIIPA